jgi:hypothetical protein
MKREDLEALRAKVSCEAALENAGYEIDHKQSTRRAVKYRHGSNIAIVTHDGRGWFDPLSDNKGDVFELVMFLERIPFPTAVDMIASLVGHRTRSSKSKASWSAGKVVARHRGAPAHGTIYARCAKSQQPSPSRPYRRASFGKDRAAVSGQHISTTNAAPSAGKSVVQSGEVFPKGARRSFFALAQAALPVSA